MMESTIHELEKCLVFKVGSTHIRASKQATLDKDFYKFNSLSISTTEACAGETNVEGTVQIQVLHEQFCFTELHNASDPKREEEGMNNKGCLQCAAQPALR